jgi:hypothetical protein
MVLIDIESALRTKIDGMLITASWADELKARIGIEGVSQIWSVTPGWYLWLSDGEGPYELSLASVKEDVDPASPVISGCFTIKCFPRPDSEVFHTYSSQERALITSELFDDTNTPTFDGRDRAPSDYFTVGAVTMSFSLADERFARFSLEAPDSFRRRLQNSIGLNNDSTAYAVDCSQLLRNVPAAKIARHLFDCLVALHAFSAAVKPAKVIREHVPGFEVLQSESGIVEVKESDQVVVDCLTVLFTGEQDSCESGVAMMPVADISETSSAVVFEWTAGCACHSHPPQEQSEHVSSVWWDAADVKRQSSLGSTCGCH